MISKGLGDEEHVSKAKFAGSPDSNSPCNVRGEKDYVWLSMRTLRANLRAFFLVMASKSIFFFLGGGRLPPGPFFTHCASLARNEQYSCMYIHIY